MEMVYLTSPWVGRLLVRVWAMDAPVPFIKPVIFPVLLTADHVKDEGVLDCSVMLVVPSEQMVWLIGVVVRCGLGLMVTRMLSDSPVQEAATGVILYCTVSVEIPGVWRVWIMLLPDPAE